MKGMTVFQPWASLECLGLKGTETRGRRWGYRGPLLIHAAKRWTKVEQQRTENFRLVLRRHGCRDTLPVQPPLGAALGVTEVKDCFQVTEKNQGMFSPFDREVGDLTIGRWVMVFDHVRVFPDPIPWLGKQGPWDVPPLLMDLIEKELSKLCP